jgi:hypothetical protein
VLGLETKLCGCTLAWVLTSFHRTHRKYVTLLKTEIACEKNPDHETKWDK